MLDSKKTALAAKMVAMAKEYAADPGKGINAGYRPRIKYVKSKKSDQEILSDLIQMKRRGCKELQKKTSSLELGA